MTNTEELYKELEMLLDSELLYGGREEDFSSKLDNMVEEEPDGKRKNNILRFPNRQN